MDTKEPVSGPLTLKSLTAGEALGSITSRCSGKESAVLFLGREKDDTRGWRKSSLEKLMKIFINVTNIYNTLIVCEKVKC